jgi:uncharacterized iron-regulated membrane protein
MRADLVRTYKAVHTWTGILSGMALFIAFFAGALTVFKEPLAEWASPAPAQPRVALADASLLVQRVLAADPRVARDFWIQLHDGAHLPGRMTWQERDPATDDHDLGAVRHYFATLDAQGAAHVHEDHPSPLASFIDTLHRVVGLPTDSDPNRWVMGVVAALYAVALVSGVVVLLPSLVKDFFALRVGKNLKRMWLDAHNLVGLLSLPFHLVMALTAVVFAFHDQIYGLQDDWVHGGRWTTAFSRAPGKPETAAPRDPGTLLAPAELLAKARAVSPGFEPSALQYLQVTTPRATVRVWGKDSTAVSPRARGGFLALDPYSGQVLSRDFMPGHQSTPNVWISSFFALHMAAFGGAAVQWLYFLLGMAGAWLFYSGNLLWVESRRKRAVMGSGAPPQRLDTRLMASATVGVCLGCVCGIALMLATSRALPGRVEDLLAWHQGLYYAGFFGALVWAFLRGPGPAAVHLLGWASALTLAMPLGTALAWLLPGLMPWQPAPVATWGVDLTALAGAVGWAWMARATARRVRQGAVDSVWSTGGPSAGPAAQGIRGT